MELKLWKVLVRARATDRQRDRKRCTDRETEREEQRDRAAWRRPIKSVSWELVGRAADKVGAAWRGGPDGGFSAGRGPERA